MGARLAVVTMVYNEADLLPIWLAHYARHVGEEHCFIVDHGSDDGSTEHIGRASRLRIPRSPMDEERRCAFLSEFCGALLRWYDAVAYTDSDELLVADPALYPDLPTLAERMPHDVVTAFGLNVLHRMHHDVPLTEGAISAQRRWVYPTAAMAKPQLIRRPVVWPPGFHSYDGPPVFAGLFNLHLAQVDYHMALRRQAKRRSVAWAYPLEEHHPHKVDDERVLADFLRWSALPVNLDISLDADCRFYQRFIDRIRLSSHGREQARYKTEMNIWASRLWLLPERFVGTF